MTDEFMEMALRTQLADAEERVRKLEDGMATDNNEICQTLGRVLGYPWYKDDQKNFPGATEANGVCVGEHVAASLAAEAARRVRELEEALGTLLMCAHGDEHMCGCREQADLAWRIPSEGL